MLLLTPNGVGLTPLPFCFVESCRHTGWSLVLFVCLFVELVTLEQITVCLSVVVAMKSLSKSEFDALVVLLARAHYAGDAGMLETHVAAAYEGLVKQSGPPVEEMRDGAQRYVSFRLWYPLGCHMSRFVKRLAEATQRFVDAGIKQLQVSGCCKSQGFDMAAWLRRQCWHICES